MKNETTQTGINNRLLATLPRREYDRLLPGSQIVHLAQGEVLCRAGDRMRHAYFLDGGLVSWTATTQNGETLEVAMICNNGVAGTPITLRTGVASYQLIVQLPADALRVKAEILQEEFDRGGKLQEFILRYMDALLIQIAQSALCACFHSVEKRLCRWLLIARDCAPSDSFNLTHDFISYMLGRSRPNVTTAARTLQRAGLINYSRGQIRSSTARG